MDPNAHIKLGYWAIRGRGQVPRLLLAYTGANWEDKSYGDFGEWFGSGDRAKLELDFPNLPYLIQGDLKLTETSAICRYIVSISSKKELLGKSVQDAAKVDMVMSLLEDIFNPVFSLFFSPRHEEEKKRLYEGKIKAKLEELAKFIGSKDTALGYLTLADFKIAEAVYYFEKMYHGEDIGLAPLQKIRNHVEALPPIAAYYASEKSFKKPFMPNYAKLQF